MQEIPEGSGFYFMMKVMKHWPREVGGSGGNHLSRVPGDSEKHNCQDLRSGHKAASGRGGNTIIIA